MFQGHLVAMDVSENRLRGLAATAEQQGVPPGFLTVQAAMLQKFAAEHTSTGRQLFDKVLLDVPCSGLGVLSKRADLRWRRRPADVAAAAALQVRAACVCVAVWVMKIGMTVVVSCLARPSAASLSWQNCADCTCLLEWLRCPWWCLHFICNSRTSHRKPFLC